MISVFILPFINYVASAPVTTGTEHSPAWCPKLGVKEIMEDTVLEKNVSASFHSSMWKGSIYLTTVIGKSNQGVWSFIVKIFSLWPLKKTGILEKISFLRDLCRRFRKKYTIILCERKINYQIEKSVLDVTKNVLENLPFKKL